MLLHFALVLHFAAMLLHFAAIITFCGVTDNFKMASTSGGGHGGKHWNLVRKGILEKRSSFNKAGNDVIKGYLGMKL